jgi:hypothetical protein
MGGLTVLAGQNDSGIDLNRLQGGFAQKNAAIALLDRPAFRPLVLSFGKVRIRKRTLTPFGGGL